MNISNFSFKLISQLVQFCLSRANMVHIKGHWIYNIKLNSKSVIIDLGANIGSFYQELHSTYGSTCFAVEASPDLFDKLPICSNCQNYNFAISDRNGHITFNISYNPEANSASTKIATEWV